MSLKNDPALVLGDPNWLPSHWRRADDALEFAWIRRASHAELTFLEDEYLEAAQIPTVTLPLSELGEASPLPQAPSHYIFHSAFCCSTLLARVFDLPGIAMALKEPQILNDLAAGARAQALPGQLLQLVARLLGRPFATGECVVIKPSNVANLLAPALLERDAGSKAIFVYAPLPRFLRSVADKGLWGRIWARRLFATLRVDTELDLGHSTNALFELTDLQLAALAWLMHHAQAATLIARFPMRVRTLDSETFLARRNETLLALSGHFGLSLTAHQAKQVAVGPVFGTHAKELGRSFDPEQPLQPRSAVPVIDEEIQMVTTWAQSVARHADLPVDLPMDSALLHD